MAAVSHGARHLRHVAKHPARSIHTIPRPTLPRIFSETRAFFSRVVSHLITPGLSHPSFAVSVQPALIRPAQFSDAQSIRARFSLPVKHALSRPFSPPRLPKPPVVPANVTQVGLGTARAFHSGRPIFQNMVDNVPIATRALWEAEWDVKTRKKEARRIRRATQIKTVPKSQEMSKPKPLIVEPQCGPSELDVYFPVAPTPAITTHLLVPLAPTPTARLPLSARTDGGGAHPLLPIPDLASIHTTHRLHSLRVSTLFARLDSANVWDDPGVNVDAYAFGPRHDAQEKQCTVLRVTFKGWNSCRVRSILGVSAEEWYSLEETHPNGHPTLAQVPNLRQDVYTHTRSETPSLESDEMDSSRDPKVEVDDLCDVISSSPIRASASAQHDLVLPTLDFSSAFSDAVDNLPPPPPPATFLRTVSELTRDAELVPQTDSDGSWECLGLNQSVGGHY
ncbi:hypothetical protein HD554DRAFT_642499 [Boletus coccyginus]|nr:hypothetical protein HD554DRAFT_642499 [Boletus coccyginus]